MPNAAASINCDDLAVLVVSCDKFSDCWPVMFYSLEKYWPDCPFQFSLLNNYADPNIEGVKTISIGHDSDWSSNLIKGLKDIKAPFVMLLVEDGWFTSKVETAPIIDFLQILKDDMADYIRLRPDPPPDKAFHHDKRLGAIADHAYYRTSIHASIWRKEILIKLLVPGESAWDFEIKGTIRSRPYGARFLSSKIPGGPDSEDGYLISTMFNAIRRGKWTPEVLPFIKAEGLDMDLSTRLQENRWDLFSYRNPYGYILSRIIFHLKQPTKIPQKVFAKITAIFNQS